MGLWKDKTRKDWCYKFQYQKKQYGSRGYPTKKEAQAAREQHRRRVKSSSGQTLKNMGFRVAASLYLDDAKRRFVSKTYKYKAYVYKCFLEHQGDIAVDKFTAVMIDSYLKTRKSNHNYNVHRKELLALFNFFCNRLKVIQHNPVVDLDKLPHTPSKKQIPRESDVAKLLAEADPEKERPLLVCILHMAARVDEVLRLTWKDVDFKSRTVVRWTRKRRGGVYEPIKTYLNNDLYEVLESLWNCREQDDWIFFNAKTKSRYKNRRKMLYAICKRAGINPSIHFHELRHFVASILAHTENVSKKTISEILGHKSLATTEIYLHSIEGTQKAAIISLEGRFVAEKKKTATITRHQK